MPPSAVRLCRTPYPPCCMSHMTDTSALVVCVGCDARGVVGVETGVNVGAGVTVGVRSGVGVRASFGVGDRFGRRVVAWVAVTVGVGARVDVGLGVGCAVSIAAGAGLGVGVEPDAGIWLINCVASCGRTIAKTTAAMPIAASRTSVIRPMAAKAQVRSASLPCVRVSTPMADAMAGHCPTEPTLSLTPPPHQYGNRRLRRRVNQGIF